MRYQYVVILKKNSEKATDALSFFLCLLSSISFLYHAVGSERSSSWFLYTAAAILLVGLTINFIARRAGRTHIRYRYLLLVAALGWMASPFLPWLCILLIILAFLEYQTK